MALQRFHEVLIMHVQACEGFCMSLVETLRRGLAAEDSSTVVSVV